jgi:hypothetical protein
VKKADMREQNRQLRREKEKEISERGKIPKKAQKDEASL